MARESATMPDDGELHLRAKVMAARHALATVHATSRVPTDANALTDLESFRARTERGDAADDFVAQNRGILRKSPLIVQDGKIRVTQAAVFNRDLNFVATQGSEIHVLQ
jgi:hypothetical protein